MDCKDMSKLFTAYLDDEVTLEEREQIQAHLSTCRHCREELEALAATQSRLRQALKVTAAGVTSSAQAWAGLRQRLEAEERPRVTIWGLAKSKVKGGLDIMIRGLVSRQPVWKTALAGVLAVALIAGLAIALPSLTGQSPEALAAKLAEKDPQVQAFLNEGGILKDVVPVRVTWPGEEAEGDFYRVTFELSGHPEKGEGQTILNALVDVDEAKLIKVERGYIPSLTDEQKEKAIEIARSDAEVQEFIDRGATIYKVTPLPSFSLSPEERPEVIMAGVALELEDAEVLEKMFVEVNLTEEKVVRVQADRQELTVPEEKILSEEEKSRAREIAEADPEVQEILQSGATILDVLPAHGEGIVCLIITADHPKRSWTAQIDLKEGKVIEVKEDVVTILDGTE